MNEETMVIDEITTEEVNTTNEAIEEKSGGGLIAMGVIAFGTLIAGITAFVCDRNGKLDERRIKKLEKKGYVVTKPEPVEEVETEAVLDNEAE